MLLDALLNILVHDAVSLISCWLVRENPVLLTDSFSFSDESVDIDHV